MSEEKIQNKYIEQDPPLADSPQLDRKNNDYLAYLKEKLNFILATYGKRLTSANGDNNELQRTADETSSRISDAEGDISAISQRADSIESSVSNIEGEVSQISQRADNIEISVAGKVGTNEVIAKINASPEQIKIAANRITVTGYVTFSDLSTAGNTTINGANVTTGTVKDAANKNSWNLQTGAFTITNGSINITTASSTSDQIILKYGNYQAAFRPMGFETKYNSLVTTSMDSYGSINNYFREIPGIVDTGSTQFGCWGGTKYKSRSWLRFDGLGVEGGPNGATDFDYNGGRGYFGIDVATGTSNTPTYDTFVHLEKWGNGTKSKGAYLDVNRLRFYGSNGQTTAEYTATGASVIDKGSVGGWAYRKWSDNTFECWKEFSVSIAVNSAWQQFCYGEFPRQSYPVTFTSAPYEYASLAGSYGWATLGCGTTKQTTTQTSQYYLFRPAGSTASATTYNIEIYARGTVS